MSALIIGLTLLFLGFILIVIGFLLLASGSSSRASVGGVVLIGPIPIVFGDKKASQWLIVLTLVLALLMFLITFLVGGLLV